MSHLALLRLTFKVKLPRALSGLFHTRHYQVLKLSYSLLYQSFNNWTEFQMLLPYMPTRHADSSLGQSLRTALLPRQCSTYADGDQTCYADNTLSITQIILIVVCVFAGLILLASFFKCIALFHSSLAPTPLPQIYQHAAESPALSRTDVLDPPPAYTSRRVNTGSLALNVLPWWTVEQVPAYTARPPDV